MLTLAVALTLAAAAPESADAFEAEVIAEINRARTDPRGFADVLRDYRRYFRADGSVYMAEFGGLRRSQEGVAAVDEAIAFLEAQPRLEPLAESATLAAAARDHSDEQGPRGGFGHEGRGGSKPGDRVTARGGDRYVAETITYGQGTPLDVVIQLIVDDGVRDRGHRIILFDPSLRWAGAGCGYHRQYDMMCTIDLGRTERGTAR